MGKISRFSSHVSSGASTGKYYSSMNNALLRLNNEYTMLHYPLYGSEKDTFLESQTNLTDYCMSLLPPVRNKSLLEVGCGNGVQAIYILEKYAPGSFRAIDLNQGNIDIAKIESERMGDMRLNFAVDDAHHLSTIEENSLDFVIAIESAFHFPDKSSFIKQINRVLKPGGYFLIADILTTNIGRNSLKNSWKRKMSFFHWPMETYEAELQAANFQSLKITDITPDVIRGFKAYKRWLKDMKKQHFLEDLSLKLYYTIHVRINVYLLKTRRQYCVFVGSKADS
jgi:ubiquinone/menaquinone biosynthesis C-methylase UbiE